LQRNLARARLLKGELPDVAGAPVA
jgi:hypothetical protein